MEGESTQNQDKKELTSTRSIKVLNIGGDKLWQLAKCIDKCDWKDQQNLREVTPSAEDDKRSFDYLLRKEREVWDELVRLTIAKFIAHALRDSDYNDHVIMPLKGKLSKCDLKRSETIVANLRTLTDSYGEYTEFVKDIEDLLAMKEIRDRMILRNTMEKSDSREDLLKEKQCMV